MSKLSRTSRKAIEDFANDAKAHGVEQEWGVGSSIDNARQNFEQSKTVLEQRLLFLERKVAKQQERLAYYKTLYGKPVAIK